MSRQDYAHWNEEADYMWWQEEGRHEHEPEWHDDRWDDVCEDDDVDDNGDDPGWVEYVRERDAQFAAAEDAYKRDEDERVAREEAADRELEWADLVDERDRWMLQAHGAREPFRWVTE